MKMSWLKTPGRRRRDSVVGVKSESLLVPVSGAKSDEEVVFLACELLEPGRSRIHIIYTVEVARDLPIDAAVVEESRRGEDILARMESVAKGYGCNPEAQIVQARSVAAALVREAADKSVDAIVMGTSQTRLYGEFSLDDTVLYVLRHAHCRVILFRDSISPMGSYRGYGTLP